MNVIVFSLSAVCVLSAISLLIIILPVLKNFFGGFLPLFLGGGALMLCVAAGLWLMPDMQPKAKGTLAYLQGEWARSQGDAPAARKAYREALEGYPNPSDIYLHLGELDLGRENTEGAMASFQRALTLNPKNNAARIALARQERKEGNDTLAMRFYSEALDADSDNTQLAGEVADLAIAQGRKGDPGAYGRAARLLKRLLQKHKDDDSLRFKLAEALYAQGNYADAMPLYCALALKNPDGVESHYSLALNFAQGRAYSDAAREMRSAAELISGNDSAQSQDWIREALRFEQRAQNETDPPTEWAQACTEQLAKAEKPETEH